MHLIMTTDGTFRQSETLRWLRALAYFLIGAAGILLLVSPVFRSTTGFLAHSMAVFLAVGGPLCCLGAARKRWAGEFCGLPLLASSFLVFGIITFRDTFAAAPFLATANLAMLAGFSVIMMARWRVVLAIYKIADRFKGDPG